MPFCARGVTFHPFKQRHDGNENPSLGIYNIQSIYDTTPCEHPSLDLFTPSQRRTQPFTKRRHKSEIDNNNASRGAILTTMADVPLSRGSCFYQIVPKWLLQSNWSWDRFYFISWCQGKEVLLYFMFHECHGMLHRLHSQ